MATQPQAYIDRVNRERQRGIDREGSPFYTHSFGIIAATTGREYVSIETRFADARKYAPLDFLEVTNNSGAELTLHINGDPVNTIPVPAGVIKKLSRRAIWSLALTNASAVATAATEVIAVLQRLPVDADEAARRRM